jgi:predicted transposase YbfD/YdcC
MILSTEALPRKSRLAALLDHFAEVEDPRDVRRILHPLPEVLLLVVCGTIADCDGYEDIAAWGAAHLGFLRRHLPYANGVPGERWLTMSIAPDRRVTLMNRINPGLFAAAFADWVRESWPEKADLVAIDGRTSRRSHDRGAGAAPLHLVSAFATTARLVLAQEAVPDKANELAAIPPLLERLGVEDGLKGALVSIDAIATNPDVARAIAAQGADWLLAVKANQPSLRAEVEAAFAAAEHGLDTCIDLDKGHGRIEERRMAVLRETDWLEGTRRFPGEVRLPGTACLLKAETRVERAGATRAETRYFISSRPLTATEAAAAVRGHWAIENRLHWVLDVTFGDDQSCLRKGHGARNMATVRHFALNLVRTASDKRSIKSRRKIAGWDPDYLDTILSSPPA